MASVDDALAVAVEVEVGVADEAGLFQVLETAGFIGQAGTGSGEVEADVALNAAVAVLGAAVGDASL